MKTILKLKKRSQFVHAAKKGSSVVTAGLVMQCVNNLDYSQTIKIGFTVSGKVGKAVTRNRIKRRLKVIASTFLIKYGVAGKTYVVIGRKAAYNRDFNALTRDFRYALAKLHNKP